MKHLRLFGFVALAALFLSTPLSFAESQNQNYQIGVGDLLQVEVYDEEDLTKEDLSIIQLDDVQEIFESSTRKKARIPIDEELLRDALEELNEVQ